MNRTLTVKMNTLLIILEFLAITFNQSQIITGYFNLENTPVGMSEERQYAGSWSPFFRLNGESDPHSSKVLL